MGVFCQDCEPSCTDNQPGDHVVDPRNCSQYYVCLDNEDPSSVPLACPPNTPYFDPSIEDCITEHSSCAANCTPPVCTMDCVTNDFIPDSEDCNMYYICLPAGVAGPIGCPPETPYFDSETELCVEDKTKCCSSPCTPPICEIEFTQIPDLTDCTKFFLCLVPGPAGSPDNMNLACPPGENYDISIDDCSPSAPCIQPCAGLDLIRTTTTDRPPYNETNSDYSLEDADDEGDSE